MVWTNSVRRTAAPLLVIVPGYRSLATLMERQFIRRFGWTCIGAGHKGLWPGPETGGAVWQSPSQDFALQFSATVAGSDHADCTMDSPSLQACGRDSDEDGAWQRVQPPS